MAESETIVIIDGYNVIHSIEYLKELTGISLEKSRDGLIRYCHQWMTRHPEIDRMIIVFDGDTSVGPNTTNSPYPKIITRYTPSGVEADDVIMALIQNSSVKAIRIVSDDMELVRAAAGMGAERIKTDAFHQIPRISRSGKRSKSKSLDDGPLSRKEQDDITRELENLWCPEEEG